MKRKIIVLLFAVVLTLSGCGSSEKVITRDEPGNKADETADKADNSKDTENKSKENDSHKGYVFNTHSIAIAINEEAAKYLEALGEPVSYYESASCAFGDLDKIYTFQGFEMDTYSMNGKDYVSAIVFHDDSVATAEGISVGDSADKVKEVYGAADSEEENGIVYAKDKMKLCFIIQDGIVIEVQYLNTILDNA